MINSINNRDADLSMVHEGLSPTDLIKVAKSIGGIAGKTLVHNELVKSINEGDLLRQYEIVELCGEAYPDIYEKMITFLMNHPSYS